MRLYEDTNFLSFKLRFLITRTIRCARRRFDYVENVRSQGVAPRFLLVNLTLDGSVFCFAKSVIEPDSGKRETRQARGQIAFRPAPGLPLS